MKFISNRITIFVIIFCLIFSFCDSQNKNNTDELIRTISIASFNTLNLADTLKKDFTSFCWILSRYDLIALIEIRRAEVLELITYRLKEMTNNQWDYVISEFGIGRTSQKEFYAFIYRSDKGKYLEGSGKIWNDINDEFEREPFYASFKFGNFDFIFVVIHIKFSGGKKSVIRQEVAALYKVYTEIVEHNPREKDIILAGDFNLNPSDKGWNQIKTIPTIIHLISSESLTTLNLKGELANSYDNIWIQESSTVWEYSDSSWVDYYYDTLYGYEQNPAVVAKKKISDHLPIGASFIINKRDDD